MKRALFLIPVVLFYSFAVNAQLHEEYVKGSLLFKDGRKETALILNEETGKLNYSVSVKDSSHKKSRKNYAAAEIAELVLDNGKQFKQITFTPHKTEDTLTVLGRLLVTGRINLYKVYYKELMILIAIKENEIFPLQKDEFTSLDIEVKKHFYNSFLISAVRDAPEEFKEKAAKIDFDEKDISRFIFDYNKLYSNPAEQIKIKNENKKFWIGGLAFNKTKNTAYAFWGFVNYRLYFTDFSRSTSFNTGFHFYNYQYKANYTLTQTAVFTRSIASIPVFVQQNLLNKSIRPYLFGGFNFSYVHTKADKPNFEEQRGFQKNYGFHLLGGAGMELNILPHLMLKADYRFENYTHGLMGGVAVVF